MNAPLALPHFQQSADGYLLPACARMVLAYLGIKRSESQFRKALGTETWGTPTLAVQRLVSINREVIYFVRTGFLDDYTADFAHALVVVGANPEQ
jgi:hypothetical protein